MEDILASIRRILNEEDAKPAEPEAAPQAVPAHPHSGPDILELDQTMMLPEPIAASGPPASEPPVMANVPPPSQPAPSFRPDPTPTPARPAAVPFQPSDLVAPEAAAATAASVGSLLRTLATERSAQTYRGGPTIEDVVREEVRPMLKHWLDSYLPPIVERLVRAEIERLVSRSN